MKTYFFNRRQVIILLRWLLFIILGYIILLGEGRGMTFSFYLAYLGIFAGSNIFISFVSEDTFKNYRMEYAVIIFDILFISASIYFSGDLDLYVIYFLTILVAAFGGDVKMSLIIAILAGSFYSFISYRQMGADFFLNRTFLVRIPFFYLVALITSFQSQEANLDKDRLQRTKRIIDIIKIMGACQNWDDLLSRTGETIFDPKRFTRIELIAFHPDSQNMTCFRINRDQSEIRQLPLDHLPGFIPKEVVLSGVQFEIKGRTSLLEKGINADSEARSCYFAPAVSGEGIDAWMIIQSRRIDGLKPEEEDMLKLVAGHLSSELARIKERKETVQKASELGKMIDASHIINQSLDLNDVLNRINGVTAEMVGAQAAFIFLVDAGKKELVFQQISEPGMEQGEKFRLKLGQGIAGWVAQEKKELIVPDAGKDPRFSKQLESMTGLKVKSLAAVPLIGKRRAIGVLEAVNKKDSGSFAEKDISILKGIASQASMALERAKLYTYMEEQTNETIEMYLNLEKEKSRVETILASMGAAIMVCDESGDINLVNRRARSLMTEVCHAKNGKQPTVGEKVAMMLKESIDSNEEKMVKVEVPSVGEIFQLRTTPIITNTGKVLGGVASMEDITELHRLNEMKTEFLSQVSHELRTPLTSVSGAVSLLLRGRSGEISEQQTALLCMIKEESGHLTSMVNNLLDLSRLELGTASLDFKPIKLEDVTKKALAVISYIAESKGISISKSGFDQPLPKVSADVESLRRVFINLLSNAVKFTPDNGEITIGATIEDENQKESGTDSKEVIIWVKDTGIGISKEDLEGIFDKFYRSQQVRESGIQGTGLGLAICRQVIQAHGGRIWAESKQDQGSTFFFTLPAVSS